MRRFVLPRGIFCLDGEIFVTGVSSRILENLDRVERRWREGQEGDFFFFFFHVRSCFQSKRQFSRGLSFKFLKLDCI